MNSLINILSNKYIYKMQKIYMNLKNNVNINTKNSYKINTPRSTIQYRNVHPCKQAMYNVMHAKGGGCSSCRGG